MVFQCLACETCSHASNLLRLRVHGGVQIVMQKGWPAGSRSTSHRWSGCRVRQLSTYNRTLDERLKAARSNLRFQDRRIADLEARLTESANPATGTIR